MIKIVDRGLKSDFILSGRSLRTISSVEEKTNDGNYRSGE